MKTWYVGTATPSHTGTYMVLETPQGRGAKPYVVHMEGFTGYLSTRFFTSEQDWRFTGLFNHPKRSLSRVEVRNLDVEGQSYMLSSKEDGTLALRDLEGNPQAYRDTAGLRQHFLRFKKVHLETYESRLNEAVEDSLRSASGAFELTTWNKQGARAFLTVHWKPGTDAVTGEVADDLEQLYGVTSEGEVVLLQRFVFDPLIRGLAELTSPQIAPVASAGLPMPTN